MQADVVECVGVTCALNAHAQDLVHVLRVILVISHTIRLIFAILMSAPVM